MGHSFLLNIYNSTGHDFLINSPTGIDLRYFKYRKRLRETGLSQNFFIRHAQSLSREKLIKNNNGGQQLDRDVDRVHFLPPAEIGENALASSGPLYPQSCIDVKCKNQPIFFLENRKDDSKYLATFNRQN